MECLDHDWRKWQEWKPSRISRAELENSWMTCLVARLCVQRASESRSHRCSCTEQRFLPYWRNYPTSAFSENAKFPLNVLIYFGRCHPSKLISSRLHIMARWIQIFKHLKIQLLWAEMLGTVAMFCFITRSMQSCEFGEQPNVSSNNGNAVSSINNKSADGRWQKTHEGQIQTSKRKIQRCMEYTRFTVYSITFFRHTYIKTFDCPSMRERL